MLITCDRLSAADLATWRVLEAGDAMRARRVPLERWADAAIDEIERFARDGGYAGVSWGKDSVVIAHLVARLRAERGVPVPLAYVRIVPVDNPYCPLVRDAFLARHEVDYHEVIVECPRDADGRLLGSEQGVERGAAGFAECARRWGDRYVSGVRAQESRTRRLRTQRWGLSTVRTCAPIAKWTAKDVYAYLHKYDLPVHPSYAMSMGGAWDRDWLRVASIAHGRGSGQGAAEWERRYYPAEWRQITGR